MKRQPTGGPSEQAASRRSALLQTLANRSQRLSWEGYRQVSEQLGHIDLTMPQAMVLMMLNDYEGRAKMSELARLTQASPGTLTGIVDRLTTGGLVARQRTDHDRRAVYVSLTTAGRAKVREIEAQRWGRTVRMMAGFSDDELEQFNDFLARFLAAMEATLELPAAESVVAP